MVAEPYQRHCEMMQAFAAGQVLKRMNGCGICFSPEQENMISRFNEMLNMKEVINATRKQAVSYTHLTRTLCYNIDSRRCS